jgi:hypothetical protein
MNAVCNDEVTSYGARQTASAFGHHSSDVVRHAETIPHPISAWDESEKGLFNISDHHDASKEEKA